jgi:peptidoglycan/xylan/chitin deacetylase (PgdA/CDA1 family)
MLYLVSTPKWMQWLYSKRIWEIAGSNKVYLTFDDGPHPVHTPWVLDELKKYGAKATFFCIGKNVALYPDVYRRILDEGHAVGNHTQHHLNGWKGDDAGYLEDVQEAAKYIDSNLFRPPYGRLSAFREKTLRESTAKYKIIMWSVLSGDFDPDISKEQCLSNVVLKTKPGAIIVFHDSEKAAEKMKYALSGLLTMLADKGFKTDILNSEKLSVS